MGTLQLLHSQIVLGSPCSRFRKGSSFWHRVQVIAQLAWGQLSGIKTSVMTFIAFVTLSSLLGGTSAPIFKASTVFLFGARQCDLPYYFV